MRGLPVGTLARAIYGMRPLYAVALDQAAAVSYAARTAPDAFDDYPDKYEPMSEDTRVSLKEYIESHLTGLRRDIRTYEKHVRRYIDTRLKNLEDIFADYRAAIVIEFQKVNEFRKTLGDVVEFQASSKELNNVLAQMQAEVKNLRERVDEKADRSEISAKLEAFSVSIRALERAQSNAEGAASRTMVLWLGLGTVVSLVLGALSLVLK